jgi:hypothetical protein
LLPLQNSSNLNYSINHIFHQKRAWQESNLRPTA